MKKLECKLLLSMLIHFLFGLFIFYCMLQVESSTNKFIFRFFLLYEYSSISVPVGWMIIYLLEYIVYKIKPLESSKEKIVFWIVTVLMTGLIMFPF